MRLCTRDWSRQETKHIWNHIRPLIKAVSSSGERKDLEVTWRELSITKAKPNFESLILIDHFGEETISKSNQRKSLIYMLCNFYVLYLQFTWEHALIACFVRPPLLDELILSILLTIWRYGMLTLKLSFMLACHTIRTLVIKKVPRFP